MHIYLVSVPLSTPWQRATVANVSLETESTKINWWLDSNTTQNFHRAPLILEICSRLQPLIEAYMAKFQEQDHASTEPTSNIPPDPLFVFVPYSLPLPPTQFLPPCFFFSFLPFVGPRGSVAAWVRQGILYRASPQRTRSTKILNVSFSLAFRINGLNASCWRWGSC